MSRYTFKTVKEDRHYTVAYGFDHPLQEYFIQVYDNHVHDEDYSLIVSEGSFMTRKSNSEMLELYEKWNVPEKHITMLTLDLPF